MATSRVRSEVIVDALHLACRAPSLHNSQPWRWVITDHGVDLFADPSRLVRSVDQTGRQAMISCGTVLHHFRVAMAAAGWDTRVQRFPDPDDSRHVATVTFAPAPSVPPRQRHRADAILARRTDRLPLAEPPDIDLLPATLDDDEHHGVVRIDLVADHLRPALAEASQLTEGLRLYDTEYHQELFWWTGGFASDEGIPVSSLISAPESDRVAVGRTFPVTRAPERRTDVEEDRSRILVLSTVDESCESVLRCGEALSAVLLDATTAGLATCTLTHLTELTSSRGVVASLIDNDAIPQVLIRVGLAPALEATPPPTPRRHIDDVIEIRKGRK